MPPRLSRFPLSSKRTATEGGLSAINSVKKEAHPPPTTSGVSVGLSRSRTDWKKRQLSQRMLVDDEVDELDKEEEEEEGPDPSPRRVRQDSRPIVRGSGTHDDHHQAQQTPTSGTTGAPQSRSSRLSGAQSPAPISKRLCLASSLVDVPTSPTIMFPGRTTSETGPPPSDDDVLLRSSNGVDFMVKKYHLQSRSKRFLSVLNAATSDPMDNLTYSIDVAQTTPFYILTLATPSEDLRTFLELLRDDDPGPDLAISDITKLWTLARRLDAPSVTVQLKLMLYRKARFSPWSVFSLASQIGDVELGRSALHFMGRDKHKAQLDLEHLTASVVKDLNQDWMLGLVRATAKHPGFDEGLQRGKAVGKWALISEDFDP